MTDNEKKGRSKIEEAIGNIDERYILEASEDVMKDSSTVSEKTGKKKGRNTAFWIRVSSAAAAVVLVVAGTAVAFRHLFDGKASNQAGKESAPNSSEYYEHTPTDDMPNEAVVDPSGTEKQGDVDVTDGTPRYNAPVYLTASTFSSSRKAGPVTEAFRRQYADFAAELLKKSEDKDGKLVSPLSVMTALAMTANGAKGNTLAQFVKVLGGGTSIEELNAALFNYWESLPSGKDSKFEGANAIWCTNDPAFSVKKSFVDVISDTFRADIVRAALGDPNTVDDINNWCSDRTDGMIPQVLKRGDIDDSNVMVLLNALCFDALWREQYRERDVVGSDFYGENKTINTDFLSSKEHYYISGENVTGFVKPYLSGYSFVALLPAQGVSADQFVGGLTGEKLLKLLDGAEDGYDVRCLIPKFSFDYDTELSAALKEMGIINAFGAGADLSGLGYYTDPNGGTHDAEPAIGFVIHKTHIEVDESGTRAAAVTAVGIKEGSVPDPQKLRKVILDRPFVYMIIDDANKLPVFIGIVKDV